MGTPLLFWQSSKSAVQPALSGYVMTVLPVIKTEFSWSTFQRFEDHCSHDYTADLDECQNSKGVSHLTPAASPSKRPPSCMNPKACRKTVKEVIEKCVQHNIIYATISSRNWPFIDQWSLSFWALDIRSLKNLVMAIHFVAWVLLGRGEGSYLDHCQITDWLRNINTFNGNLIIWGEGPLIFSFITAVHGYESEKWLTKTMVGTHKMIFQT